MAFTDTMFLFEIVVEELISYINCSDFDIRGQFADVFNVHLPDPKKVERFLSKQPGKRPRKVKSKLKCKTKIIKYPEIPSMAPSVQSGPTILFAINVDTLISNMKQYPLELSLWSKAVPDYRIGSTGIPWSTRYYEYLNTLDKRREQQPLRIVGDYNVFDEITSKRMAVIKLSVKLRHYKDRITKFSSYSTETVRTTTNTALSSTPIKAALNATSVNATLSSTPVSTALNSTSVSAALSSTPVSTALSSTPVSTALSSAPISTALSSTSISVASTIIKDKSSNFTEDTGLIKVGIRVKSKMIKNKPSNTKATGLIKTDTSDEKRSISSKRSNIKKKHNMSFDDLSNKESASAKVDKYNYKRRLSTGIYSLVRSDTKLDKSPTIATIKSKSMPKIDQRNYNILNEYIFGGTPAGPFGNQVYFVNYFTVENDFADSPKSPKSPSSPGSPRTLSPPKSPGSPSTPKSPGSPSTPKSSGSPKSPDSPKSSGSPKSPKSPSPPQSDTEKMKSETSITVSEPQPQARYKFRICKSDCPIRKIKPKLFGSQSVCSLDLPEKAAHLITVKKCDDVKCIYEKMREVPTPPDDRILLHLSSRSGVECCQKIVKKIEEKVITAMKAKMQFGSEPCYCECECQFSFMKKTTFCKICGGYERFGEDYGEKPGYELPFPCPIFHKLADKSKTKISASVSDTKNKKEKQKDKTELESDKESKKKGKKHKDNRFKFNYGYTAPHIGHSRCALPCVGTLGAVPKRMGWLWTCENVPGMKYRPQWKPGASNKHVVRLLKIAKNPGDFLAKKRKKEKGKPKRPLKRPLLTVQKKDGEFTVTMETMKTFTKPRTYNQYPYEDKPLVTYTIGRTSEENLQRKVKKERARRRLERLQRDFVQTAFRDMCKEICLKTYQQALGMLPNAEEPDCSCFPADPGSDDVDQDHSCSCSEDKELSESDTDSDEWMIEFTPPTARFDPTYKSKKLVTAESSTQYTYLDYRVKLLDRLGNPVPRFFRGPDGKQQCSDLGGFWDAEHNWLEINVDGFIGPDERWAPNNFIGPNNEMVDGESGKFQTMDGNWLVIGVDGYVENGKWKYYAKSKNALAKKKWIWKKTGGGGTKDEKRSDREIETTWSCFGTASPKQLSKMGIVGHGYDKKLLNTRLHDLLAQGEDVKIPQTPTVPRSGKPIGKRGTLRSRSYIERTKCKHAKPSDRGIVAVDGHGNKTYFRLKQYDNMRPKDRMTTLTDQGISVSSFHVPCLSSFISSEVMKKQQYDRLVAMAERRRERGQTDSRQENKAGRRTTATTPADYHGVYVV